MSGAAAVEAAVEHYNEHGYAVVEGIFDDTECVALGRLVSSLLAHEIAAIEDAGVSLGPGRHGPTPRTTVELDGAGNIAWQLTRPLWEHAEVHGDASTPSPFRTKALDPRITAVASALVASGLPVKSTPAPGKGIPELLDEQVFEREAGLAAHGHGRADARESDLDSGRAVVVGQSFADRPARHGEADRPVVHGAEDGV